MGKVFESVVGAHVQEDGSRKLCNNQKSFVEEATSHNRCCNNIALYVHGFACQLNSIKSVE